MASPVSLLMGVFERTAMLAPDQLSQQANAWVDAFASVAIKIITTIAAIWGLWCAKKAQMAANQANARADTHGKQIDTIMMNMSPPGQQNVAVAVSPGIEDKKDESTTSG